MAQGLGIEHFSDFEMAGTKAIIVWGQGYIKGILWGLDSIDSKMEEAKLKSRKKQQVPGYLDFRPGW